MALQTLLTAANSSILSSAKLPPQLSGDHHLAYSFTNSVQNKSRQAYLAAKKYQDVYRLPAYFGRLMQKDTSVFTSNLSDLEIESNDRLAEELKQKVKEMLIAATNNTAEKISLINSICQLGVSYHFESQIEEQLNQIFEAQPNLPDDNDYDLYTAALIFRVFRQHGYRISCGMFNKFKDSNCKFNENLTSDARGMLSLYEATHLRLHGEDILEDALHFTRAHLKSFAAKSSHLAKHINEALELPLHHGIPRLEARRYISFYEEDYKYSNETLFMFAKLDFNRVQLLHQQELSYVTSWWKDLNLAPKYSYSRRERIREIYFWACAQYFEPCYSSARIILTKILTLLAIVDDTYDAYTTLEELQRFTDAIQRWEINALDDLPDYLKPFYNALLNLFDELDNEMSKEGRSYSVSHTKDAIKEITRAYLVEDEWFREGFVPPFDELTSNALVTGSCFLSTAASFVGMGEIADTHAFKWLQNDPNIVRAAYTIGHLQADILSHQFGLQRGRVASTVDCYMKQYGTSKEETVEMFKTVIADAWKDINQELMKATVVSTQILLRLVNVARLVQVIYKNKDGIFFPGYLKEDINRLFIDPIPI